MAEPAVAELAMPKKAAVRKPKRKIFIVETSEGSEELHEYFNNSVVALWKLGAPTYIRSRVVHNDLLLYYAARTNRADAVAALIEFGEDVDVRNHMDANSTALHAAAKRGYADVIRALLLGRPKLDMKDAGGKNALFLAADNGHFDAAAALIDAGAEARAEYPHWISPIHVACRHGHVALTKMLLADGKPLYDLGIDPASLLEATITQGGDMVEAMVSSFRRHEAGNALHISARRGRLEAVTVLLAACVPVNWTNKNHSTPLHLAAEHGHADVATALIAAGATINFVNKDKRTPLHQAAAAGSVDVVAELLEEEEVDVNYCDAKKQTPLFLAAQQGHAHVVEQLLEAKARADVCDAEDKSPLFVAAEHGHYESVRLLLAAQTGSWRGDRAVAAVPLLAAAQHGHLEVMKMILASGADVDAKNEDGTSALFAVARRGRVDAVQLLLAKGATVDAVAKRTGRTPLFEAAEKGHLAVVELLLAHGADVNAGDRMRRTPLFSALAHGHTNVVSTLFERGAKADVVARDGQTPLHDAAAHGNVELVQLLLARGANPAAATDRGKTPLCCAAESGRLAVVQLLLVHDAPLDGVDTNNRTALHLAVTNNHVEIVQLLLARGADPFSVDSNGQTPLHDASASDRAAAMTALLGRVPPAPSPALTAVLQRAVTMGCVDAAEALLARGAILCERTSEGATLLHLAAELGSGPMVDMLCRHGADVDVSAGDRHERTPLHYAAARGHLSTVAILLARGTKAAAVDADGWSSLHLAAWVGDRPIAERLLAAAPQLVHAASNDELRATPLYVASLSGCAAVVKALLASKANIEEPAANGATPLLAAAFTGDNATVAKLLEKQANVKVAMHNGWTPLYVAARGGHNAIVKALLERGAHNNQGPRRCRDTPLYAAAARGHMAVVHTLLVKGGAVAVERCMNGATALHAAALHGHTVVVKMLLQYHAARRKAAQSSSSVHRDADSKVFLNGVDADSNTPLLSAARARHHAIVQVLLEAGASARVAAADGETLLTLAAHWRGVNPNTVLAAAGCLAPFKPAGDAPESLVALSLRMLRAQGPKVHEFEPLWTRMTDRMAALYEDVPMAPSQDLRTSFVENLFAVARLRHVCSVASISARLVAIPTVLARVRDVHDSLAKAESALAQWRATSRPQDPAQLEAPPSTSRDDAVDDEAALLQSFAATRVKLERDLTGPEPTLLGAETPLEAASVLQHTLQVRGDALAPRVVALMEGFLDTFEIPCTSPLQPRRWYIPPHALWVERSVLSSDPSTPLSQMRSAGDWAGLDSVDFLTFLREKRKLGQWRFWQRIHEIACGLVYLAKQGIAFRVLRAEHICVGTDGRMKVDALGASMYQRSASGVDWSAPELERGERGTTKTVAYTIAMCALEALTADALWRREGSGELTSSVMRRLVPLFPDDMWAPERSFIASACAPDPSMRPSTIQLIAKLRAFALAEQREGAPGYYSFLGAFNIREYF
ncbi:hypothetical protein PybrP1_009623 [[Pythium] brassicae (nom. inval.)]|nr:hypothetical protein PybrP1_009623 [[Pythium] brassicae (nom. inval.)]